jgi:hypothetical protein
MKKEFRNRGIVITMLAASLVLSGCGGSGTAERRSGSNNVENAIEQQMKAEDEKKAATADTTEEVTTEAATEYQGFMEPTTAERIVIDDSTAEATTQEYLGEPDPNVDVDLTVMGRDMVYATVYQMMLSPEDFIGKKVKCRGQFAAYWFENTSKWYSYCIIQDALACCQQGLEFSWDDGNHDISEFPDDGVEVEVVGTFITYKDFEEDELSYCQLSNATMTILDDQSSQDETVNQ